METKKILNKLLSDMHQSLDCIGNNIEEFAEALEQEKLKFAQEYHANIMQQNVDEAMSKVSLTPDEIAQRILEFMQQLPRKEQ